MQSYPFFVSTCPHFDDPIPMQNDRAYVRVTRRDSHRISPIRVRVDVRTNVSNERVRRMHVEHRFSLNSQQSRILDDYCLSNRPIKHYELSVQTISLPFSAFVSIVVHRMH